MFASRAVLAILGVVVLSAAGCGGGDSQVPSDQQALAEEIKTLGGIYFIDKKAPDQGMFSIDLSGTKADDAFVAKLSNLPGLKHLKLNAAPVTSAAVASIKKMKTLETLDIGNTKITAEGAESIRTASPNLVVGWNAPEPPPPDPESGDAPAP